MKLFLRTGAPAGLAACFFTLCLAAAVGFVPRLSAQTSVQSAALEQEYFVRQGQNEAVLIRVDAVEALFQSRVRTIDGEILIASGLPGSRLAPLFQFINDTPDNRQLNITVTATADTDRSAFKLGLSRINVHDQRSARLAQAYEWLSFGQELPPADTPASWSIKVNSLLNASRLFEEFGMDELRLWSRYSMAQLTLLELGDPNSAMQLAVDLLRDPRSRRYRSLLLAAEQLRTESLAAMRDSGELADNGYDDNEIQSVIDDRLALATSLGAQFERASALYFSGQDFASRGLFGEALNSFQAGLQIADSVGADDLSTLIRESLVDIHGQQGDVAATSEVLQAIESQLSEDGASDDLAQNLLAQGQLFNRNYRYPEAVRALSQALEYEHNSATRAQVQLELGRAYYELGEWQKAVQELRAALLNPSSGQFRRRTSVLNTAIGLGYLADVHRYRNEYSDMRTARDAQGRAAQSAQERAEHLWHRAQDKIASGASLGTVRSDLESVQRLGATAGLPYYSAVAQLELCRLGAACPGDVAQRANQSLQQSAIPRHMIEGGYRWAQVLLERGSPQAGQAALERVVDDVALFQHQLSGVLGAWYWGESRQFFDTYLDLTMGRRDARQSWRALARVRWAQSAGDPVTAGQQDESRRVSANRLRAAVANLEAPEGGPTESTISSVRNELEQRAQEHNETAQFLRSDSFSAWLDRVPATSALLDFHIAPGRSWLFLGSGSSVRQIELTAPELADQLDEALSQSAVLSGDAFDRLMIRMGSLLLGAVAGSLPETVWVVSSRQLLGLPFDALDAGAGPLVVNHQVAWVVDLPGSQPGPWQAEPGLQTAQVNGSFENIFLAGQPSDFTSGFLDQLTVSQEMRAVMNQFVGPGLQVLQGAALLADEFSTDEFRQAELVHLCMPGVIQAGESSNSYLQLSEERRGLGRQRLTPLGIDATKLQATLVFMSQTKVEHAPVTNAMENLAPAELGMPQVGRPRLDGRPGLVNEWLSQGASNVIATFWQGSNDTSSAMVDNFYTALSQSGSVPQAMRQSKLEQRAAQSGQDSRDWARYQVFVR